MRDIRKKYLRPLLYPISLLYRAVMGIRNFLFDKKLIKSTEYILPVIVIGNLTIGGTGKTPMTEYLIRLLQYKYNIAILSRGYGRRSKGFVLGNDESTARDLGDEPCQMVRKFPGLVVAVDADRRNGIARLCDKYSDIETLLLDDAFQHRYVKPGLSILLMDCNRPIYQDRLLPLGDLREPFVQIRRADLVIVTKCSDILPIEKRIIKERLNLRPHQKLFFSTMVYCDLQPLNKNNASLCLTLSILKEQAYSVLIVTGIAQNSMFVDEIGKYAAECSIIEFDDHHYFESKDFKHIEESFLGISNSRKCIIMTEKDATRLRAPQDLSPNLQSEIYYLPIKVEFLDNDSIDFNKTILDYVGKNKRDGFIH